MKKRIIWLILLVLAVIAVMVFYLGQQESQGIAYRISGGKNEMVILGSIHVGSREMYPMRGEIREAIRQADALVFECDTEAEEAAKITAELMHYPSGDMLSNHISPETRELLSQTAKKIGMDDAMVESVKPWALTSMLSVETASGQMGSSSRWATAMGVEERVRKQAEKKPRLYLETAEEQLRLMDAFSPELQEYLLRTACESILSPAEDQELSQWPAWWADGYAEAFAASYLTSLANEPEPELASEYHGALITRRNQRMAQNLAVMLEEGQDQRFFVTIGLMHLVLPGDSVLSELEKMGYRVESF